MNETYLKNNSKLLELVIQCIPYPNQITDIDSYNMEAEIRFTWRGIRFKVTYDYKVSIIEGEKTKFEYGSNLSILLEALLKEVRHENKIHNT